MAGGLSAEMWQARGRVLLDGSAEAPVLILAEPLSLWGGLDAETGLIIDQHHPQRGGSLTGRALVMPAGRGSSSSSSILAEALRRGTGPRAVLLATADEIIVVGALVAQLLYDAACPVLELAADDYRRLRDGDRVAIRPGGLLTVRPVAPTF